MQFLSKDAILAADDLQVEDVQVPEWGGWVRVRGLSGVERDAFEQEMAKRKGKDVQMNLRNIRARLAQLTVVDEGGKRLFTHQDIEALGNKSARALERVFSQAMKLSGLSETDVEELAENFGDGQSDDSTSS